MYAYIKRGMHVYALETSIPSCGHEALKMQILPFCFLAFTYFANAAPSEEAVKVKESIVTPRGWVQRGSPPANYLLELRVALAQPNFEGLERHLYEIRYES